MYLTIFAALIAGVLLYRLGRREGEAGRVLPLLSQKPKACKRREQKLLEQIERFDGSAPKGGR